jgi:hypothetical protein
LGQLAGAAAIILAADKISDAFEKAGNSSGILAAEFVKTAGILAVGVSLLSGRSIKGAITSFIGFMGPWGAAISAAIAALGIFTAAATKAVDVDVQGIIDAAAKKVSEIKIEPGQLGNLDELQDAVGKVGIAAIEGVSKSGERFEQGLSGVMAGVVSRVSNLFSGEGLISISDSDSQAMIETIIGNNPEQLNEIIRSAIEQFGASGLESGLDQIISESLGGSVEAASRIRQAMVKQAGGLEKIANSIADIQLEAKVSQMASAIDNASSQFDTLRVPIQLSSELRLLSDSVGKAAREIETNAQTFNQLSQNVGRDVGVTQPTGEFSTEAVENIVRQGKLGDFLDLSNFPELEGFTTDMAKIGKSLDDFMTSIIKSKANADSLRSALADPQVDPFDILNEFIQKFIDESPDKLPPEAENAFRVAAQKLGADLSAQLAKQGGVIFDDKQLQAAFDEVLGKQTPFFDAAISTIQTWLNAQVDQLNLAVSGEELLAGVDVATSELGSTILTSLQNALGEVGIDLDLPIAEQGFQGINDVMVELSQRGDLVGEVLEKFKASYTRHAELNREIAEAQNSGTVAGEGLLEASRDAAIEVLNLQVALTQLSRILQKAPQAFAEQQERQAEFGLSQEAAERNAKEFNKSSEAMSQFITRTRQFIEAQVAIDVGQVFEEPANIFAKALTDSANAVRGFTRALTTQDLQKGFGAIDPKTTPEGRIFTERSPVPEATGTETQRVFDKFNLQAAVFGSSLSNVTETVRAVAADIALQTGRRQSETREFDKSDTNKALANQLENFSGFIPDILKIVSESGLDKNEVALAVAESLKEQAAQPGASEIEFIGAIQRPIEDLAGSIQSLLEKPELGGDPGLLRENLSGKLLNFLEALTPLPETTPIQDGQTAPLTDISSSAAIIQEAAIQTQTSSDTTSQSASQMELASSEIRQGGADIVLSSRNMMESVSQLKTVSDAQRDVLLGQQNISSTGVDSEGSREAIAV